MGIRLLLLDKDTCQITDETELARYWRTEEWLKYFKVENVNGHPSEIVGVYIQLAIDKLTKNGHFPEDVDYTEFASKLKNMLDMTRKYPDCVWFTEHASDNHCVYHTLFGELPYCYPRLKQMKKYNL